MNTSANLSATRTITAAAEQLGQVTKKAAAAKATAKPSTDTVNLNEAIKGNPLYQIVVADTTSSTEEKVSAIASYMAFAADDEVANAKKIDSVSQLLEYIQSKQKNNAVKQIETVADKSSANYQSALGKVIDGLKSYNDLLAPLQNALEVLQQKRDPAELRIFIQTEKGRMDEYVRQQEALRQQIQAVEGEIRAAEDVERQRRRGWRGFFLGVRETLGETEQTKQHKAHLAELQA
jgi:hypothetical protein